MSDNFLNIHKIEHSDYKRTESIIFERAYVKSSFPIHWHDHYELVYFLSGKGTHIRNGLSTDISSGSLHFIMPTDIHSITVEEPMEFIKIIFEESDVGNDILMMLSGIIPIPDINLEGSAKELFFNTFELCRLHGELHKNSDSYKHVSRCMLETVLSDIIYYCKNNRISNALPIIGSVRISLALNYIHMNFRRKIDLEDIAGYVHFSPSYFSRLFKSCVGKSFKEYLETVRLRFSAGLLSSTQLSVTEICFASGFGSLPNFNSRFKEMYGVSPTEYRMVSQLL